MLFKRGDTTKLNITLSEPLHGGHHLKIGIFDDRSRPLWSVTIPDDTSGYEAIGESGDTYLVKLEHDTTKDFIGELTLRTTVYKGDGSYVNSGEQIMTLRFVDEPINKNLI